MKRLLLNKKIITLIACIISILITTFILMFIIKFILNITNENRCYNLPINDFYKDKRCLKYTDPWEYFWEKYYE